MNIDKKAGHIDPKVALSQAEHEKEQYPDNRLAFTVMQTREMFVRS